MGGSGADTNDKNIHEYENHFSSMRNKKRDEKVHLGCPWNDTQEMFSRSSLKAINGGNWSWQWSWLLINQLGKIQNRASWLLHHSGNCGNKLCASTKRIYLSSHWAHERWALRTGCGVRDLLSVTSHRLRCLIMLVNLECTGSGSGSVGDGRAGVLGYIPPPPACCVTIYAQR